MPNPMGGGGLSYSGSLGVNIFGEFGGSPNREKHSSSYFIRNYLTESPKG